MDISTLYKCFTECSGVTTDSRNCPEGSMFIALKGETFNGNAFAAQALEKGCRYAVVDEEQYAGENPHILLVDNCLRTLQELANFHRRTLDTLIIGITGTNGKTTTKELIRRRTSKKTTGYLYIGQSETTTSACHSHCYASLPMTSLP